MRPLFGKLAVVTGGGSGLGAATARRLAAEGAHVVVADIDDERAERAAAAITDDGNDGEPSIVDVAHEGEVAAMFEAIAEQHGRLDLLVCSAAVETRASVVDTTDDEWRHVLDVNLKGPFLCMKYGIPPMIASGGGSVVLLGSILGAIGSPGYAAYCASKGALVNLAKQAAIEHAPDGVRVNVVSPSACETGPVPRDGLAGPGPRGDQADGRRPHADGPARHRGRRRRHDHVPRRRRRRRTSAAPRSRSTAGWPAAA